ncbi:hypothetical protein [Aureispira anguillae]|uniref:Uncharacterized protein n=1 Tax=Aureispira anguillae TaxID=2864201 RepID=A0A916DVG8_9BACT|nr:hypothetical protein [Aureispira anguillae]BDS13121.1 hypothetical protein AsAng_0038490 [Aureispira anguillae]
MLENNLLDGDKIIAYTTAVQSKKQENVLLLIATFLGAVAWYLGYLDSSIAIGALVGGMTGFCFTIFDKTLIYYYSLEHQQLILYTMNRFGAKEKKTLHLRSIKRIRLSSIFINQETNLTIEPHSGTRLKYTAVKSISFAELKNLQQLIKPN